MLDMVWAVRSDRPDRRTLSRLDAGELIRDARQIAGLSQAKLAAQFGTTQSVLSRWERGVETPRVNTLGRLLQACGFEVDLRFRRHDDTDREAIRAQLDRSPSERLSWALERARSDDDEPGDHVVLQNLYALEDEIAARESSED
jgi:transcriptional regulator with XRE-family HTH domain